MTKTPPLVLASTSPYRRALLDRLQLDYAVASPDVDESWRSGETARDLVLRLAEAKARAVAPRFPDALIIGSDQVAALDNDILGKPLTHERAVEQLERLSGRRLTFFTGLCLFNAAAGRARTDVACVYVKFRELSDETIARYLRKEQPYHCAGAFKSEALGIALVEALEETDPTALIGLPLIPLVDMLHAEHVRVV